MPHRLLIARESVALAIGAALASLVGVAAVGLAYRTEPWVPLALTAVAVSAFLALSRPLVTLYLAVGLIPLELLSVQSGDLIVSPSEVLFVLTAIGWVSRRLIAGRPPWVPSPLTRPMAVLAIAILPGVLVAVEVGPVLRMLVLWTAFFLVFQLVVDEGDMTVVRNLLAVLAAASGVVAIIGAIESGWGSQIELGAGAEHAVGRAEAVLGHPNNLAALAALGLSAGLGAAGLGRGGWRLLGLSAAGACVLGLTFSLSRAGFVAALMVLGVMLFWRPVRVPVLVAAGAVALGVAAGAAPLSDVQLVDTVTGRVASISYTVQGVNPRIALWETTPEIIADYPLTGIGANNFSEAAPRYGLVEGRAADSTFDHAHNIPLTIGAELGLVALAALTLVVFNLFRLLVRSARRAPPELKGAVFSLLAAMSALAVVGMFDYPLRVNTLTGVAYVLAGASVVVASVIARGDATEAGTTGG